MLTTEVALPNTRSLVAAGPCFMPTPICEVHSIEAKQLDGQDPKVNSACDGRGILCVRDAQPQTGSKPWYPSCNILQRLDRPAIRCTFLRGKPRTPERKQIVLGDLAATDRPIKVPGYIADIKDKLACSGCCPTRWTTKRRVVQYRFHRLVPCVCPLNPPRPSTCSVVHWPF